MESLILLCIGLIAYLFYRINSQKHQLTNLHSQIQKLQQQFTQLQQRLSKSEEQATEPEPDVVALKTKLEPLINKEQEPQNNDSWTEAPTQTPSPAQPAVTNVKVGPDQTSPNIVEPNVVEQALARLIKLAKNYFSQGNQIVRIGIIVLFFGMSFLAKYSIENSLISIEVRMVAILIAALIMLGIGWHLRIKNQAYGLMMQGGGIAISYIAIFTSFKLYQLIPPEITFPLLMLFSIFAMSLAVMQNSRALAITAITGGFAAPILASTGQGSHIGLFSYYLVLNCAIFFVAWFKSWRLLNVIGFLFTFIVASIWGATQYRSAQFDTTEPFLIAFFLIYVAISILFSIKQKPELKGYVDGTLVFGVPMVGFGLQTALVHHMEYGLAYSAAALAVFYAAVTYLLRKKGNANLQLMSQAMLALAAIFATLTIPFALDGRWTAASWAIEGAGFVWIALRQQREFLKYIGLAIQALGGLLFLADYPYRGGSIVFLNAEFMGIAIITLSALFTAYLLQTEDHVVENHEGLNGSAPTGLRKTIHAIKQAIDAIAAVGLMIWGLAWWYIGGLIQVDDHISRQYELTSFVAFLTASAGLWLVFTLKGRWQQFSFFPWLLLLPLCLYFWPTVFDGHFLQDYGFISWPLGLALLYVTFYKLEQAGLLALKPIALHSISYLLIISVVSYELAWLVDDAGWVVAWSAFAVMLVLIQSLRLINYSSKWPFNNLPQAYQVISAIVIIGLMLLWSLIFNFIAVLTPTPVPYLPLFNPIDVIQLLALWTIIKWYSLHGHKLVERAQIDPRWTMAVLAIFCFIWLNVLLLKTIHLVAGVEYRLETLYDSAIVQTSISITWTIMGLAVMIIASNKSLRWLWIVGASLAAVVVAKLFILDLAGQETIERIVSFLVVGVLLLVVGYFSPVPPAVQKQEEVQST